MCIFNGVVTVGGQWSWVAGGSHGRVPESGLTILLLITIVIRSNPAPRKSAPHPLTILTTLCFCLDCSSPRNSSGLAHCSRRVLLLPEGPSALNRLSWRRASGRHTRPQPPPYRDRNPARNGTGHRHRGPRWVQHRQERRSPSTRRERGHRRRLRGAINLAWQRWPRLHRADALRAFCHGRAVPGKPCGS